MPLIFAGVHHGDPVAEGEDLVELGRDDEGAVALVAIVDDLAVDVLDRTDVEPSRGLGGDEELEVAREFARDDHLLLVATRERADQAP